ncbi:MAG: flavodoxin domain-containing protein [Prolixibacteraceae bacterium]|nr:flavodoxin domain-containing protein [Prolixibacteraceae bacterium]
MKRAIIFYQSKTGTTKNYAKEIEAYLQTLNIDSRCIHVNEYKEKEPLDVDYLMLGCWTKGLMILFQKPDEVWNKFAEKLNVPDHSKVALFATYKISTGSMFKNMEKQIHLTGGTCPARLKSRNGTLSKKDKAALTRLVCN